MGLFVGILTQAVALFILTVMTDWQKQAEILLDWVYSSASAMLLSNGIRVGKSGIPPLLYFNDSEIIS